MSANPKPGAEEPLIPVQAMAREAGVKVTKRLPPIEPTLALETDLYVIFKPVVAAYIKQLPYVEGAWLDAGYMTRAIVDSILSTAVAPGRAQLAAIEPKVEAWAEQVERWHRKKWAGAIRSATGGRLNIEPILSQGTVRARVTVTTQNNVALITKLSGEMEAKLTQTVWTAYGRGDTGSTLAKTLREEYGFAPKRAKLIARDQLAKYADALDEARAAEAGLETYKWKGNNDGHERPTHLANNDKTFRNDTPPPVTGHPGHDVNCRCKRAIQILSAAEEAELEAKGLGGLT